MTARFPSPVGLPLAAGAAGGFLLLLTFFGAERCRPAAPLPPAAAASPVDLQERHLRFPVPAVAATAMADSFAAARGERSHHAVDILAPRGSAVVAVDDGTVVRLSSNPAGGIAIYHLDPTGTYCFYYAHLEGYAPGLRQGLAVRRGELIGYVGSTGNAPRRTPHLHFAISRVVGPGRWWEGAPIDPFPLLSPRGTTRGEHLDEDEAGHEAADVSGVGDPARLRAASQ